MFRLAVATSLFCLACAAQGQNLRLGYFGETATHYGFRGGAEFTLNQTEKSKNNGGIVRKELFLGLTLTLYRHPQNHVGAIFSPELGFRRTGKGGGLLQAALSPGLFRSFYEGATWQPGDDGKFEKIPFAGQWGFIPGLSLGLGHDFSVKGGAPVLLFANLHYMQQHPYNSSFLHKAAVEAGIIFKRP